MVLFTLLCAIAESFLPSTLWNPKGRFDRLCSEGPVEAGKEIEEEHNSPPHHIARPTPERNGRSGPQNGPAKGGWQQNSIMIFK
jgi:hypothetical protein